MSSLEVTDGEIDFSVPAAGKPCKTYYKIFGDLKSGVRPLVIIHGGPGISHDYILPLSDLTSSYGIPVIFYDALGCGLSTHLPEKKGDTSFWTEDLTLNELDNLLVHLGVQDNYDILGHSWGGMLGARHAVARQPKGLKRLIVSNSPADMHQWMEAQNALRSKLPQDVQDVLQKHEDAGTTDSAEYEAAVEVYYKRHVCVLDPWPSEMGAVFASLKQDDTVYLTMNGPSEFHVTGVIKGWSITSQAHKITVPTLLINGRYDEAQDLVVEPFFREIPKVKWVTFAESSHMPFLEERDRYMQVVGQFLTSK